MKKGQKLFLALALALSCGVVSASAQIFVTVRPVHTVVVRTEAPSPRHVWIDEDWNERDGRYEYTGGHWAEPPHEGYRYHPGSWDHGARGHSWRRGSWQPEHNERDRGEHNGEYRGEHNEGNHGKHNGEHHGR